MKISRPHHFVSQASLDAAQAILADQNEFRLPTDQWEEFCSRLDEPPKVIPALRRLFDEQGSFSCGTKL